MSGALRIIVFIVLGFALGLGSAWFSIMQANPGALSNGVWRMDPLAGSAQADDYSRAYVAITGLLALNRSETIYYVAERDAAGEPLSSRCEYSLVGRDPDTRWWSVTVYGADNFLIDNEWDEYSISKTNVVRDQNGRFTIRLAAGAHGPNAIPTGENTFNLLLRLYNPGTSVQTAPDKVELPQLIKGTCRRL